MSLPSPLLPEAPNRIVFDRFTPEAEAAHGHLAALLIGAGDPLGVTRHRYAYSLGIDSPAPTTRYVHYFTSLLGPDGQTGALVPVTTSHTPGLDDLGGLIQTDP
ncbi:MAG: hypothetical protein SangKO_099200 [Sandaracinaceae bacterium]